MKSDRLSVLWRAVLESYPELLRFARRTVGRLGGGADVRTRARDVLHDAICRQATASTPLSDPNHALAVLKVTMRSVAVDMLRRPTPRTGWRLDRVAGEHREPDVGEDLRLALDRLRASAPALAQIVDSCLRSGRTPTEVGRELGIPASTARHRWRRAIARLRRSLHGP